MNGIPSLAELNNAFHSEGHAEGYLAGLGYNFDYHYCYKCGSPNIERSVNRKNGNYYRCKVRACRYEWSMYKNTFFAGKKLGVHKILQLAYFWLNNNSNEQIVTMCGVNKNTVTTWFQYFRELITWDMDTLGEQARIGGEGIIVEVDESKFGKRKYNIGHHVEGVWVVGGVERTPERRMFAVAVQNRSAATLRAVIHAYVHPGTMIYTDGWKGYQDDDLLAIGMGHDWVNHSVAFVNENGVHTNHIEGTWAGIKLIVCRQHRTMKFVDGDIIKFIWKRQFQQEQWSRLVRAMCTVTYEDDIDALLHGELEPLPDAPFVHVEEVAGELQLHEPSDTDSDATDFYDPLEHMH